MAQLGFDLIVNGIDRTFRDLKPAAYEAAMVLKTRRPRDEVSIRNVATGGVVKLRSDGRTD